MKRISLLALACLALAGCSSMPFGAATPAAGVLVQYKNNQGCSGTAFGNADLCYDASNMDQAYYNNGGTLQLASPAQYTVATLPACTAGITGAQLAVTDSTTVSAEGQTCSGSSTHKALAVCVEGGTWKCF